MPKILSGAAFRNYLQFSGSSLTERGLEGVGTSPGVGDVASSSGGTGDAAEVGVIDPVSSSPSSLSPSSGAPSSPPSPAKNNNDDYANSADASVFMLKVAVVNRVPASYFACFRRDSLWKEIFEREIGSRQHEHIITFI